MNSLSSLEFASEFMYPMPQGFCPLVGQIKFQARNGEDMVVDVAKEGICPFKVRYIVSKMRDELLQDADSYIQLNFDEPEILRVAQVKTDTDSVEALRGSLLKKFSELSNSLLESVIAIDTDKAEYLLRHFDKFVSNRPKILAFIDSDRIKFIYKTEGDKFILDEEFENVSGDISIETIDNIDKKDIIKLHLAKDVIDKAAAKVEIGVDFVKIEGFSSDLFAAKFEIHKAMRVNFTIARTYKHEIVMLLANAMVMKFCNEELKRKISNSRFVFWEVQEDILYVVGRNQSVAEKALDTIENCLVTVNEDFSGLTLSDESHLINFKEKLEKDFQGGIVLNDDDWSKITVITTVDKFEQAKLYIYEFKTKFTVETLSIACSKEKTFYLEDSERDLKEELFGGESIRFEKEAENVMKVTAYKPELSIIERKTIHAKIYGLNNKDIKENLTTQREEMAKKVDHCRFQILDDPTKVDIKDGKLEDQQVDVIVNSVSSDLKIEVDNEKSVTFCIARSAGPDAQKSLREKYPDGLKVGEVAFGKSGNLRCKELYHVALEKFTEARKDVNIKDLNQVIQTCLETANKSGYTSIALPAVAAGVHCYPHGIVATTILQCIVNYIYSTFDISLKTVTIAIPQSDVKVKKAFKDEIDRRMKILEEQREHLILQPSWLCQWKVNIVGETVEGIEDCAKIINTISN